MRSHARPIARALCIQINSALLCAPAHRTIHNPVCSGGSAAAYDGLPATPALVSRFPGLEDHRTPINGLEDVAGLNAMALRHRSGDDLLYLRIISRKAGVRRGNREKDAAEPFAQRPSSRGLESFDTLLPASTFAQQAHELHSSVPSRT